MTLEDLYARVTGDEDARVCKDIPDSACADQPRNFFAYLAANLLGKVADDIASAKLILPWMFGTLGVPAAFTGFLVPIREAGVLVPQLAVAAFVRRLPIRKTVWLVGAGLSGLALFGMAWAAQGLRGIAAGTAIIAMLIVFSLARGICSVSAKDVLGKTVSKSKRGALMGLSAGLSGLAVLGLGLWLGTTGGQAGGDFGDGAVFTWLLIAGGILWLLATLAFAAIVEQPGATEGGGNALEVALEQLALLRRDQRFRHFVIARALLLSVALAPPFYVLVAQQQADSGLLGLGALIVASGLASSLSSPVWGYLGDRSSRSVMAIAAAGAGLLALFTFAALRLDWTWATGEYGLALIFLLVNVMHGGVRLGRKVYLVDMATAETRAAFVAVSNTVIGVLMLAGGLVGLIADRFGVDAVLLLLGLGSLAAAVYSRALDEVSEPA